jgi:hypothetical protein
MALFQSGLATEELTGLAVVVIEALWPKAAFLP